MLSQPPVWQCLGTLWLAALVLRQDTDVVAIRDTVSGCTSLETLHTGVAVIRNTVDGMVSEQEHCG